MGYLWAWVCILYNFTIYTPGRIQPNHVCIAYIALHIMLTYHAYIYVEAAFCVKVVAYMTCLEEQVRPNTEIYVVYMQSIKVIPEMLKLGTVFANEAKEDIVFI